MSNILKFEQKSPKQAKAASLETALESLDALRPSLYFLKHRKPVAFKSRGHNEVLKQYARMRHKRRVRRHEIAGVVVSTVFLIVDCGIRDEPALFETMIFLNDAHGHPNISPLKDFMLRATTWREALNNHAAAVEFTRRATRRFK